jgi:hypothetical protein
MAISADRKSCQCSPSCTETIRIDSSWRYVRGHSPASKIKRGARATAVTSFVARSTSAYSASIATLEIERDLLTDEIDRLEEQATVAEKTAKAAREQSSDVAIKHEVIVATITNLNLLLGIVPKEE